jgi:hypothetical protein
VALKIVAIGIEWRRTPNRVARGPAATGEQAPGPNAAFASSGKRPATAMCIQLSKLTYGGSSSNSLRAIDTSCTPSSYDRLRHGNLSAP